MQYPKVDLEKKHKGMAEGIPRPDSGAGHQPVNLSEEKDLDNPEHLPPANQRSDYRTTDIGKGPKVGRPEDCKRQPPADAKLIHQEDALDLRNKVGGIASSEERKESAPIHKENITKASKMNEDKTFTERLIEKGERIEREKLGSGEQNYRETGLPVEKKDHSAPLGDTNVAPNINFPANVPGMPFDPNNATQQGIGTTYYNTEDAANVGMAKHVSEEKKEGTFEKSQPVQKELQTKASKKVDDKTLTEKISDKAAEAKDYVERKVTPNKDKTVDQHLADAGDKLKDTGDRIKSAVKPESQKTVGEKASDVARDVKDATKDKINEAADFIKEKTN